MLCVCIYLIVLCACMYTMCIWKPVYVCVYVWCMYLIFVCVYVCTLYSVVCMSQSSLATTTGETQSNPTIHIWYVVCSMYYVCMCVYMYMWYLYLKIGNYHSHKHGVVFLQLYLDMYRSADKVCVVFMQRETFKHTKNNNKKPGGRIWNHMPFWQSITIRAACSTITTTINHVSCSTHHIQHITFNSSSTKPFIEICWVCLGGSRVNNWLHREMTI